MNIKGVCKLKYGIYEGIWASACMLFSQGVPVLKFVRSTKQGQLYDFDAIYLL